MEGMMSVAGTGPRRPGNTWTVATRNEYLARHQKLLWWAAARAARHAPGLGYEEAASDVAALVVERFPGFDPARGSFSTWLVFIARTVSHNHRVAQQPGGYRPDGPDPAGPDPGPADLAAGADLGRRVAAAMAHLPPREREAVAVRYGLDGGGGRTLREVDPR